VFARLSQHLDGDVLGNMATLDQAAHKIKICGGSRRECDLYLLEANFAKHVEHAHLALGIHGLEQRLIAVA